MNKNPVVYIMSNYNNTSFYVGVTSDLEKRVWEHKHKLIKGFTAKYHLKKLVYYEQFGSMYEAINKEKQLKNWHREWKINLIKMVNPTFRDLSLDWCEE